MAESAASKKAFYCELCSKGYSRVNEYDAHLSSYDHSHKKRLADMKAMQRPSASLRREKERKAEAAAGMITIKPIALTSGTSSNPGLRKSGFKSAFPTPGGESESAGVAAGGGFKKVFVSLEGRGIPGAKPVEDKPSRVDGLGKHVKADAVGDGAVWESDTDDEGGELYDPAFPTAS
ncbi:c2h2 finger domain-containing protein [Tirmania nivea]|nr:c2h2 finger domain-containing protein [Tirmania nivea]